MNHRYIADPMPVDGVHVRRMGMAIWLFLFLRSMQTGLDGLICDGRSVTYRSLFGMIPNSVPESTLRTWMAVLRANGYVEIEDLAVGMRIRIVESRKWPRSIPEDSEEVTFFPRMMPRRSASMDAAIAEVGTMVSKKLAIMGRRIEQKKIS